MFKKKANAFKRVAYCPWIRPKNKLGNWSLFTETAI